MRPALPTVVVLAALAACGGSAPAQPLATVCDRTAARGQSVERFIASLRPGQTGCLRGGVHRGNVAVRVSARPGAPIVVRSVPGRRATLLGRLVVHASAHDVVFEGLALDGRTSRGLPSPTVNGDRIVFRRNLVTNAHTAICFVIGSVRGFGRADGVVLERNRIHDCGRLPPTNREHGVYVEHARGTRIVRNAIYDNADRGIQLYPDAKGTLVANNVIDGNGVGVLISGEGARASSGNVVTRNVITNSRARWNVEAYWPPGTAAGTGNVVRRNCLWNGALGDLGEQVGFVAEENVVADPLFADPAGKDFRLRRGSPCAGLGP